MCHAGRHRRGVQPAQQKPLPWRYFITDMVATAIDKPTFKDTTSTEHAGRRKRAGLVACGVARFSSMPAALVLQKLTHAQGRSRIFSRSHGSQSRRGSHGHRRGHLAPHLALGLKFRRWARRAAGNPGYRRFCGALGRPNPACFEQQFPDHKIVDPMWSVFTKGNN